MSLTIKRQPWGVYEAVYGEAVWSRAVRCDPIEACWFACHLAANKIAQGKATGRDRASGRAEAHSIRIPRFRQGPAPHPTEPQYADDFDAWHA